MAAALHLSGSVIYKTYRERQRVSQSHGKILYCQTSHKFTSHLELGEAVVDQAR